MKTKEQLKAAEMRSRGQSMGDIAVALGVAKSSVSYWVRDVRLTVKQKKKLNKNGHSVGAIEKRRVARITNTQLSRDAIKEKARAEVATLSQNVLWCVGVALYWGEGGKTQQTTRLSNSDPAVIKTMMRFFRECCGVSEEKFRAHVHTFSQSNVEKSLEYWMSISGIPRDRFYKTYVKKSSASKDKRNTLPYGTVQVYVHDTPFFFRLMGWLEKIKELEKN
jgi:predicted transcriptional regulator